jgi:tetratricopeptide (TPR) repeat protein
MCPVAFRGARRVASGLTGVPTHALMEPTVTDPGAFRERADQVLELHEQGRLDQALDAAVALAHDASEADTAHPVVRESLFAARFERALLLTELGDLPAAALAYADAATTPADLDDADQRHEIAMALLNRAICLDAVGDHDAAIEVYDDLVTRFRESDDPVTADQVVRARVNRAAALLALDRIGEALTAADVLVRQLDPGDALEAEQLAMTVRLQAAALRAMDRDAEAAEALAGVERCTAEDPAARSQVAAAHRERANILVALGRAPEALATLDAVIARFRGERDPMVVEVIDEVLDLRAGLVDAAPPPES